MISSMTSGPLDLPCRSLLRPDEVARFFNVSKRTVYNWCDVGYLKTCRPTRQTLRIYRESVTDWIKKRGDL